MTHPIRKAQIHTFERQDDQDGGYRWIAMFHPYAVYPVFFHGSTESAAIDEAEKIRTEAIEKHEADVIRRQKQAEMMRLRAANKKAAKQ